MKTENESNLVRHAREELELAGYHLPSSDYDGALYGAVMELIQKFSVQGHSGMSGAMVIRLFAKLVDFKTIVPLTGEDDEWIDHGEGKAMQNRRQSNVFKDPDGKAYTFEGFAFREGGVCFGCSASRKYITFPYFDVGTQYVDLPSFISEAARCDWFDRFRELNSPAGVPLTIPLPNIE